MAKASKKAVAKAPAAKAPSKSQIIGSISEKTELSKKEVTAVLDALADEVRKALGRSGAGVFNLHGLVKITKKKVPARPAQKNVMVLGQLRDLPAKPASTKVQVRALKNLKSMV